MKIKSKINKVTISEVPNDNSYLGKKIKDGMVEVWEEGSKVTANNIDNYFVYLSKKIVIYLNKYERAYKRFLQVNRLVNKVLPIKIDESLKSSEQDKTSKNAKNIQAIEIKKYQNQKNATLEFINVLHEGYELLHEIRKELTDQTIDTNLYVKDIKNNKIYSYKMMDIESDYVLSRYGASENNPFSLAYKINTDLLLSEKYLNKAVDISEDNIYKYIMKTNGVKDQYLDKYYKGYKPVFNSKDVEIFELMSQLRAQMKDKFSLEKELSLEKYEFYRKTMGGQGGYRTSNLKAGDVGLIQDKMVTTQQEQVNFGRQQLIVNNLKKLQVILNTSTTKEKIAKELISMFTEKQEQLTDDISKKISQTAKDSILKKLQLDLNVKL